MARERPSIRRSTAAGTFAPGAIVDVRVGGAAVSLVMGGLEVWEKRGGGPQEVRKQTIYEPRLQKKLGVRRFRLPPVDPEEDGSGPHIGGIRFPRFLVCPSCHLLKDQWSMDLAHLGKFCAACTARQPGNRRIWAVPVRFICACERGHLDEFPWHVWVQHRQECSQRPPLRLDTRGAGLAGLFVACTGCGSERSMEGAFGESALRGLACRGRRPWLPSAEEACGLSLRAQQRGASNLYFPMIESALSVPPWSLRLQDMLGHVWESVLNCERARREDFLEQLRPDLGHVPYTPAELAALVNEFEDATAAADTQNLKVEEYRVLSAGTRFNEKDHEFELRPGQPTQMLEQYFARMSRVTRLREVRAVCGFTRITPPTGDFRRDTTRAAPLSMKAMDWLPAVEVRGEGLFLSLAAARLRSWEQGASVQERARRIDLRYEREFIARFGADQAASRPVISARFILLHGIAHVLMKQLSLACGYSSASLRERIYAAHDPDMCGVLIYTASPDADGTLGGLVAQGAPARFGEILVDAVKGSRWCSSDPLCLEGHASVLGGLNEAACHACMLGAETSCEYFNQFLDRALLVGGAGSPETGYFASLLA